MRRLAGQVVATLTGVFFLWAGGSKLADPAALHHAILNYHLVGASVAWAGALFLPWLETMAGWSLFVPGVRRGAAWLLLALLIVFELALASAAWRGLDIDCGCVGGGGSSVNFALVRNGFLLAALAFVLWADPKPCRSLCR